MTDEKIRDNSRSIPMIEMNQENGGVQFGLIADGGIVNVNMSETPVKRRFSNIPSINPNFTGRDDFLEMLEQMLNDVSCVSLTQSPTITGMGGIGKTSIALEYAHRHFNNYKCIWWVNSESSDALQKSFDRFARIICKRTDYKKPDELIEIIVDWLTENESWLMIFDNAEDQEQISEYLPGHYNEGCNVIVTSRNNVWSNKIAVNLFSETDALSFFTKVTKLESDEFATALCKELGYLPLAITQAAFYIRNNPNETYETYLELYKEYALDLLEEEADSERKSVRITFDIAKYKISVAAKQFLRICSMLPPDDIDATWFQHIVEQLPTELSSALKDKLLYKRLMRELTAYSLIKMDGNKISIHRLLQSVIKENELALSGKIFYALAKMIGETYTESSNNEDKSVSIVECLKYCADIAYKEYTNDEYVEILLEIVDNTSGREFMKHCRLVLQYSFALTEERRTYFQQQIYSRISFNLGDDDLYYLALELNFKCIALEIIKFRYKYSRQTVEYPKVTRGDLHNIILAIAKATKKRGMGMCDFSSDFCKSFSDMFSRYPKWWDCIEKKDIDEIVDYCASLKSDLAGCIFKCESDEDDPKTIEKWNELFFELLHEAIINKADSVIPSFQKLEIELPEDYGFEVVRNEVKELLNPVLILQPESHLYESEELLKRYVYL